MGITVAELIAVIKEEGASVTISSIDQVGTAGTRMGRNVDAGTKQASTGLRTAAIAAAKMATAFLSVSAAVRTITSASKTVATFEQSVADLSAITGATGEDLSFLSERAREFGATTTLSASEAAEAFKLVASAKPDLLENSEALSQVTKEAIALAEAAGSTLPEAARTLGSSLNQFGADADQAGRFINVLAAGAKLGASEIADTAEALKQSGTVASLAGVSFEELNAGIQTLSTVAIKGGEAGTALRNVILRLQNQTQDGFNPAVVGLRQALANLNASQLDATEIMRLFGLENAAAATALIEQSGRVDELTGALTDTTIAYEQADTRVNTLEGSVKQLNSAFEELQLENAQGINLALRDIVDASTDVLRAWTDTQKAFSDDSSVIRLGDTLKTIATVVKITSVELADLGDAIGFFLAKTSAIVSDPIGLFNFSDTENSLDAATNALDELREKTREAAEDEITFFIRKIEGIGVAGEEAAERLTKIREEASKIAAADFRDAVAFDIPPTPQTQAAPGQVVGQQLEAGERETRSGLRRDERAALEAEREAQRTENLRESLRQRAELIEAGLAGQEERERLAHERRLK